MGDTIDVTGDNTLVCCFGFLLSKKKWFNLARRLRVAYRRFFRFLNVMESFSDKVANFRAGHIAVSYGPDSILVWGGYKENHDNDIPNTDHHYWATNQICLYNRLQRTWRTIDTKGECPPHSSGSTAVVYHNELYIFCGFFHYNRESALVHEDDLDEEERALGLLGFVEKNSNNAYVLNMTTLTWKKLNPSGRKPLRVDKLASWIHGGKVYLFGGFGPPPDPNKDDISSFVTHAVDPSTVHWGWRNTRGWTNQLVIYDIATNAWEWPTVAGDIPTPRAAHACVANSHGDVFLFGGRHGSDRLNDLHHLDLRRRPLRWTLLHGCSFDPDNASFPTGRSWHTLTLVDDYHALLYGGYDHHGSPRGDCWLADLSPGTASSASQRWTRLQHLEKGDLLWHSSVALPIGQVYLVGGVKNDLLNRGHTPIEHPTRVTILSVSPPPLLVIALEAAVKSYSVLKKSVPFLPASLKANFEIRRHKFVYDRDKSNP